MKTKTISLFLAILMLLSVLSSCSKENEETDVPNEEYEDAFNYNTFAGVVVSAGDTKIDKNDNFEIAEIKVSVGDTIKEGDVLFVYDTQKATLDLERAKLELEQLENNLKNLRDTKERLEKEKTAAPADQQLQYSLEIQETETDILEGEYNIKSKTKDIENLTSNLEKKEITSPISGTVTAINKDGSQDYGQTQAFMTISETGTVRVQGYVNESNVTDINVGSPVTVKSRVDDSIWYGTVSMIDLEKPEQNNEQSYYYSDYAAIGVDSSSKYPFYVELENTDGLMLGQHVYILVDSGVSLDFDNFDEFN